MHSVLSLVNYQVAIARLVYEMALDPVKALSSKGGCPSDREFAIVQNP
jgi:hypothetical protein